MGLTTELIVELKRTIVALERYEATAERASPFQHPEHARARRASLDATMKLAEWRKYPKPWKGVK